MKAGISLYYRERGTGQPFILLHGNGENGGYFKHQIKYFSDRFRVIAVDTRGHGKSPRGTAPFTMEQFADDLNGFMVTKGISKAIILGFSDGTNIAMKFALRYPDKVTALILNSGNLDVKGLKSTVRIPIELGYKLAGLFAGISASAKRREELLGLMVNEPNIKPKELRLIQAPTLVIAGTNDMIKRAHTEQIARNIPSARLSIIQGDHFVANKKPNSFNKKVELFLRSIMQVQLIRATVENAENLWKIQVRSFSPLLDKYQDYETNPASEPIDKVKERLKQSSTYYYYIKANDEIVGAIRVIDDKNPDSRKCISPLCVLPKFQNQGIAQKAIIKAEEIHGANNWGLATILQEKGNCHLYEKMGYYQTGETKSINESMTLAFYQKD